MTRAKIDDLYFGVKVWDFNSESLKTYNLFDHYGIRRSIANYVAKRGKVFVDNPILYCFGDVWSRREWEFEVNDLEGRPETKTKVDVYGMYVEPNSGYLMSLVDSVSVAEAKRWLAQDNKRKKGEL